jgi:hypothetical protein
MANVTGQIGQESVILENAATEETLKQLVATLTTMNQSIVKTAGTSGGSGAAGGATAGLTALGVSAKAVSMAFSLMGGILTGIGNVVTATTSAFLDLATQAMDNQAKMSDFYGALGKVAGEIPILGGILGGVIGLFQQMAAMQEKNLQVYQSLTTSGINFGGSLTNLRLAASNSYMSLDAFAALMQKNSTTFAKMGGTVNDGAEAFAKMSHELIKSPAGDRLLALGYTTDQVNSGLADYINVTGGRNAQEMKNTKAVTAGAAAYMEQLDGLAQMTGKNRETLAEEMKKRAANAAWESKLQGMSAEERNKATIGMANAMATGGEGAADAFQAQVMGVAVQTKAGMAYTGMYGAAAEGIRKSADMVYDTNVKDADMNKQMISNKVTQAEEGKKYSDQLNFSLSQTGNAFGGVVQEAGALNNQFKKQGVEGAEQAMKKKQLADSEADEIAKANKGMQEFGQQIMGFLTPIIKELTPIMTGILDQFKQWFSGVDLPALGEEIGGVLKDVAEYLKNFISEEGRAKILNDIKYMFGLALIEIKKALYPLYDDEDAAEDKAKLDADKAVFDAGADAAKTKIQMAAAEKELQKQEKEDTEKIGEAGRKLVRAEIKRKNDEADSILKKSAADKKTLAPKPKTDWEKADSSTLHYEGAAAGALTGAAYGAALGSVVPVVGTAIGAVLGGAAGWFGGGLVGSGVEYASNKLTPDKPKNTPAGADTAAANDTATMPEKSLGDHLETLNKQTAEMLKHMKETSDHAKKNVEATKALIRDAWA